MVIKFVSIGMLSYLPRFVNSASTLSIKKRKVTMEFKLLTSVIMTYMNDCVLYSIISKESVDMQDCYSHFHRKNCQL
jgi:hypothetical protein